MSHNIPKRMVRALNGPNFEQPAIVAVDFADVGVCVCLALPDRSAIAMPGTTAITIGLALAEAALSGVEFLDPTTFERLVDHVERLRATLDEMDSDGKVRPTDRARMQ